MGWPMVAAAGIAAMSAAQQSKSAADAAQGGNPTRETGEQTQTGTTTRSPYAPFQPAIGQIAGGVNQAMQSPWQLPGQTLAGVNPYQTQGLNQAAALSAPGGPLASLYGGAADAYGQALDPMSGINDTTMGPLDVYSRRVGRNINEQALPGIAQGATATGNVGSSKAGIAEGIARRGGAEAIADYGGNLMANLYGQGVQSRDRAMGMLPQMQNAAGYQSENLFGVGAMNRNFAQEAFDDARMRQEYRQTEPFRRYGAGADIAYGGGALGGEETADMLTTYDKKMEYSPPGDSGGGLFGIF